MHAVGARRALGRRPLARPRLGRRRRQGHRSDHAWCAPAAYRRARWAPARSGSKVAIAELPKQEGPAFEQAERTIRAYERKDVPPKSSPTVEYVKQRTDWPESFAMRTTGGQVYALTQGGTYLCQGPSHELLVVQRGATHGASGGRALRGAVGHVLVRVCSRAR